MEYCSNFDIPIHSETSVCYAKEATLSCLGDFGIPFNQEVSQLCDLGSL